MATWEEEATWEAVVDSVETWAMAEAILAPTMVTHLVSAQTDHKFKVWRHQKISQPTLQLTWLCVLLIESWAYV